jgi:hypothetical protein
LFIYLPILMPAIEAAHVDALAKSPSAKESCAEGRFFTGTAPAANSVGSERSNKSTQVILKALGDRGILELQAWPTNVFPHGFPVAFDIRVR